MPDSSHVLLRSLSRAVLPAAVILLAGCRSGQPAPTEDGGAAKAAVVDAPAGDSGLADLQDLTLPIEGTSVTLRMIPVEAADGRGYYMSETEVTWDLYDAFIFNLDTDAGKSTPESDAVTRPSKPYVLVDRGYGHAGFAALSVSPKAAEQLVAWLSAKTGRSFRLPTVAETRHLLETSGASDDAARLALGWFEENAEYTTRKVGSRPADDHGLYDLWGNVSEYAVLPDGGYVVMGGSFIDPVQDVTPTYERPFTPDWNADDPQIPKSPWWLASNDWVGVRVVCDP